MSGRASPRRLVRDAAAVVLAVVCATAADIVAYGSHRSDGRADAAVVLGAAVWTDRPSPVLAARVEHAVDLYRRGRVPLLILTGGLSPGDARSEAEAAADAARAAGVPDEALICETASRITEDNLRGAAAAIRARRLGRVLIVSDPLHLRRAVTMARDLGLDAHASPTPTTRYRSLTSRTRFLAREVVFSLAYRLAGSATGRAGGPVAVGPCGPPEASPPAAPRG